MPWQNAERTLYIENHGTADRPKYKIGAFCDVTLADGTTYREPLPDHLAYKTLEFVKVVVREPAGTKLDDSASAYTLTHATVADTFGLPL